MTIEGAFLALLGYASLAGSVVVISISACCLIAMQPGRTTKWEWGIFYGCVCFAGWWALALCAAGQASHFEQFLVALGGAGIYLTRPRGVPVFMRLSNARFRDDDDPADHKTLFCRRRPRLRLSNTRESMPHVMIGRRSASAMLLCC